LLTIRSMSMGAGPALGAPPVVTGGGTTAAGGFVGARCSFLRKKFPGFWFCCTLGTVTGRSRSAPSITWKAQRNPSCLMTATFQSA
jgi:hypothetical protein